MGGLSQSVRISLRCGAPHGPLVENRAAVGADLLLDLVRDPGLLAERVRDDGLVLVQLAGSLGVAGCHLAFHGRAWAAGTRSEAVNKLRRGGYPSVLQRW